MKFKPFHPPFYLSNTYTQTFLASLKIRTLGANPVPRHEKHVILETRMGTRLSGKTAGIPAGFCSDDVIWYMGA